ncbi:MAG: transporter substrate-binding domain-containing protein, partial [Clostridia bacterium]|nr:transporter substrate-binding domain-containing protein [Clostridia bacterium]
KAIPIYGGGGYAYGYDVMIAKQIAENLGMDLEIHKVEWDSIGLSMDSGEYDCIIAGMGRTAERQLSYSFTEPYYYRNNCVVVKKGSDIENITGLSELAGKNVKVTTQLGTGWVPLLNQIPDAVLGANYETTAEVFMAISNGTADVAVIDLPTAESALLTNNDLKIITLDENDTFSGDEEMTNICIATRKDDIELRDKIQGAMDTLGLTRDSMNELMEEAIKLQPAAN